MNHIKSNGIVIKKISTTIIVLILSLTFLSSLAIADTAAEIDAKSKAALDSLYDSSPGAKTLAKDSKAILIFPSIVKAGLIVGGQYGEGALMKNGKSVAYYKSVAASYGLQAGVQTFGYALFFMDDASLGYLQKSKGWEIGSGPTVVVVDEGFGKKFSSTTLQKGVYAFIFGQEGLMAGIGLEGSKINEFTPGE